MDDLGSIPWLYSAVCLIFSILAGFVIQHEWDQWNDFMDAIKGELSLLRSLWLWSQHVPDLGRKLQEAIRQYVTVTIQDEWRPRAFGESEATGKALTVIQEEASTLFSNAKSPMNDSVSHPTCRTMEEGTLSPGRRTISMSNEDERKVMPWKIGSRRRPS